MRRAAAKDDAPAYHTLASPAAGTYYPKELFITHLPCHWKATVPSFSLLISLASSVASAPARLRRQQIGDVQELSWKERAQSFIDG